MSSTSKPVITYDNWSEFLFKLGGVCTPAELHGMLCGTLVGGLRPSESEWVDMAFAFMDSPEKEVAPEKTGALSAMYDLNLASLNDDDYGFRLILPEDALPLPKRIEGLGQWCQGFLHGLGAIGEALGEKLTEEGQEMLRDVAAISHADVDEEDSEESEVHYTELVEYVRVATMNLFAELNPKPKLDSNIPSSDALH